MGLWFTLNHFIHIGNNMADTAINTVSQAKASHGIYTPNYSNVIFVNNADWDNLQQRLDAPAEPNEALKKLLERGKQLALHSATQ